MQTTAVPSGNARIRKSKVVISNFSGNSPSANQSVGQFCELHMTVLTAVMTGKRSTNRSNTCPGQRAMKRPSYAWTQDSDLPQAGCYFCLFVCFLKEIFLCNLDDFKLCHSSDPPASASGGAGITGV